MKTNKKIGTSAHLMTFM